MKLVLASGSLYRKNLLNKMGLEFTCITPSVDEKKRAGELVQQNLTPLTIAETLSFEKGRSVFEKITDKCRVISGDQIVAFKNQILGKPLTTDKAIEQLTLLNAGTHQLITSVTVFSEDRILKHNHISQLKMKNLSQREIANYIQLDNPLDCSGSYKIEERGITLFESIECSDFSAIQGIPMLWLSNQLKECGYEFFNV